MADGGGEAEAGASEAGASLAERGPAEEEEGEVTTTTTTATAIFLDQSGHRIRSRGMNRSGMTTASAMRKGCAKTPFTPIPLEAVRVAKLPAALNTNSAYQYFLLIIAVPFSTNTAITNLFRR